MIGETFLISVSPKAIEKTTRFFNASLQDTLIELLQNSRRAGATKVDIALDGNILTISDDGCGMFRDRVSISLGESGWDDATQVREDAAGCGIFSLAQRGCTIEANGYKLVLDSDRFCAQKPVTVESGSVFSGTQIAFPLFNRELERVKETVHFCTRHYPVPVFFEGEQMPFKDFLAGLVYRESWNGLEIGVSAWRPNSINFYGLVVETRLPIVNNGSDRLSVRVDVKACSQLKLVLPQRKEVVQDKFFEDLKEQCYRTLYRYLATLPEHDLSYKAWEHARQLGIELPPATSKLSPFEPRVANWADCFSPDPAELGESSLIFDLDADALQEQVFWRAWSLANPSYGLFRCDPDYRDYPWYRAISRLSGMDIEVEGTSLRPDVITVVIQLEHPDGRQESLRLPTDFAIRSEEDILCWEDIHSVEILVTKESALTISELVELIKDSYFNPDDDGDRVETQQAYFLQEAREKAAAILISAEAAQLERIKAIAEEHLYWYLPAGKSVVLAKRDQEFVVELLN